MTTLRPEERARAALQHNSPILLYHKVDKKSEFGGTWVTPSQFESHIRFLKDCNYRNAVAARAARDCGYEAAFTLFKRRGENADPLYSVERTAVYRIDTIGSLRRKLERGSGARVERLKAHAINWCSRGTPVAKGLSQFLRGNSFSRLLEG